MLDAAKAVWRRQQLALANLTGNAFLLFLFYTWLWAPDRPALDLAVSAAYMLIAGFCVLWLHATTLASFHSNVPETPFLPALRRFPRYLPWAAAMAAVVALFVWLGSAVSFLLWVIGVAAVLVLLPLASQAAGEGFSRDSAIRVVTSEQYWLGGTLLLIAGLYLPWMLAGWSPQVTGLLARTVETGARLGAAYVLMVVSWLTLAALTGLLGVQAEEQTAVAQRSEQRVAALRQ
jgi:hypothetical protein